MKTFFLAIGGAVVGTIIAVFLLLFVGSAVIGGLTQPEKMPDKIVLSVDLRTPLSDQAPTAGLESLFGQDGFIDILTKLDSAASDDRVAGIFLRGSEFGIGSSRAEELRSAFQAFQASGKFVIAHSQGSFGGGPSGYRALATADELWAQPGSDIIASGVAFETLFMKGLLDKLSVTPEIEAFYEYKNSPNGYKEEDYTEPHREAMTRLAESIWEISLVDIAADRELTLEATKAALESGPLSAERMVELGLASNTGWPESAKESIRTRVGEEAVFMDVTSYTPNSAKFSSPVIAIVGGEGPINTGAAVGGPFGKNEGMMSDTISAAILEAAENERVEAIVFRVDSPGGSPTASDQIWNAVEIAKTEYNKPVVVSMGSVAASGGYYVATGADWVVANRSTITGSIGIFGGKMAFSEGLARIGVNVRSINVGGPFTGAFSSPDAFTDEQRVMLRAWLKRGYDRFLSLVAEGRDMTVEEVHERARGRVWSGEDALEQGLVDELGGLLSAIHKARDLAGIEADSDVRYMMYPQSVGGFPFGGSFVSAASEDLETLSDISDALNDPRIQALLSEFEATQSGNIQARLPVMTER